MVAMVLGFRSARAERRSSELVIGVEFSLVITSPCSRPALPAGPLLSTTLIWAPETVELGVVGDCPPPKGECESRA